MRPGVSYVLLLSLHFEKDQHPATLMPTENVGCIRALCPIDCTVQQFAFFRISFPEKSSAHVSIALPPNRCFV